jgi:hypothetical protein
MNELVSSFEEFIEETKIYRPDYFMLDKYSSKQSAFDLVKAIETIENENT